MSNFAVHVEGLGKRFRIGAVEKYTTFRETLMDAFAAPFRRARFLLQGCNGHLPDTENIIWALKNITFTVERGEVVGIIGRNGAGKSTLLKILSRITEPTLGFAEIRGRVSSLLEVGTGFHAELTGRENIYLNGAILGMKKVEIDRKFDDMVAFAEIERFIDTPVKRYSSGMYVRLAFAVAAHLEPEVLIIDEVLAVGDTAFQKKCLGKMEGVAKAGRTVLFVSHNMAAVENLCQRVIVLQNGEIAFAGDTKRGIDHYYQSVAGQCITDSPARADLSVHPGRPGNYEPMLRTLELFNGDGRPLSGCLKLGASLMVSVFFRLEKPTANFDVILGFDNNLGQRVFTVSSAFQPNRPVGDRVGDQRMICEIPSLTLMPGEYRIKVLLDVAGSGVDRVENAASITVVESNYYGTGKIPPNGFFVLKHHWHLQ